MPRGAAAEGGGREKDMRKGQGHRHIRAEEAHQLTCVQHLELQLAHNSTTQARRKATDAVRATTAVADNKSHSRSIDNARDQGPHRHNANSPAELPSQVHTATPAATPVEADVGTALNVATEHVPNDEAVALTQLDIAQRLAAIPDSVAAQAPGQHVHQRQIQRKGAGPAGEVAAPDAKRAVHTGLRQGRRVRHRRKPKHSVIGAAVPRTKPEALCKVSNPDAREEPATAATTATTPGGARRRHDKGAFNERHIEPEARAVRPEARLGQGRLRAPGPDTPEVVQQDKSEPVDIAGAGGHSAGHPAASVAQVHRASGRPATAAA